jgi:hypothetical protein
MKSMPLDLKHEAVDEESAAEMSTPMTDDPLGVGEGAGPGPPPTQHWILDGPVQ